MTYQSGDQVVYGVHGVCRIIGTECKTVAHKPVEYYVLQPCAQTSATYYIPMHNEAAVAKMRKVLTAEQLHALLESDEMQVDCWVEEENQRKECYRKLIARADCAELIRMIRAIHLHRQTRLEAGRKLHLCDENFLKDAQRLIAGEVSRILDIAPEEVEPYIREKLENKKN